MTRSRSGCLLAFAFAILSTTLVALVFVGLVNVVRTIL